MKQLIIIGGPNGVGKTTFAKPYVSKKGFAFDFYIPRPSPRIECGAGFPLQRGLT